MSLINQVQAEGVKLGAIGNVYDPDGQGGSVISKVSDWIENRDWGQLITWGLSVAMVIALIVMLVRIVMGAYKIITAGGNPKSITEGKDMIVWAIVGVLILSSAYAVLQLVQAILGVNIIEVQTT